MTSQSGSLGSAGSPLTERPRDRRLVALALATWLSALASLSGQAPIVGGVAAVALVGAVAVWAWGRRNGWARVAVALLLGVVCGSTATGARLAVRDSGPLVQAVEQRAHVTLELTVRRDPRPLARHTARPPSWLIPAWLRSFDPDGSGSAAPIRLRARVLVFASDPQWQRLLPGQRVRTTGALAPPRGGDLTAAVLSATGGPELLGEPPWPQRAAAVVRAGLRAAVAPLPAQPGSLLPGLVVGDDGELDPMVAADFTTTGLTHLLAVSGSNVALVVGAVVLLARAVRAPPWLTALVSAAVLIGYVIVCRADASVIRAGAMGAIALVALAAGRPRAALPALAATVTGLVVADPQLAADAGFAMSVLATGGLLILAPRWRDALRRRGVPPGVAEALAVPAAAQVAVAPVLAGLTGSISLVAVAANLVAVPAVAPATVLGVLAAVLAPAWPAAAEFLAWLASWPAWWLVLVARVGAGVPAAVVGWPAGVAGGLALAGVTVGLVVALRHRRVRVLVAVVVVAAVVGALPVLRWARGWPPADAVVVACAVGQGDLLVVPVGAGAAIVVDAGPDPAAADRCLRDLRVTVVPLLVVSHFHADHVGGVRGVFQGRRVAAVVTSGWPEPSPGHDLLAATAAAAGVPVQVPPGGATYQVGEVSLTVLNPPLTLQGTRSDPNNNSLILLAQVRGVRVLLTGDAEVELQRALLAALPDGTLRADVLKLPHHGSEFQEPEFLTAVAPEIVLVPVGTGNPYGHPDPSLLTRLADHARVLRTDTDGDLAVLHDQRGLAVVTREPPGPHG